MEKKKLHYQYSIHSLTGDIMSDSEILDFDQWGGLKSDGRQDGSIPKDDGVHRIIWNESEII